MQAFDASNISHLKLDYEDFQIELEKAQHNVERVQSVVKEVATEVEKVALEPIGTAVKAPMVGTFYASNAPQAAPFVTVGTHVKKGDVICIIEAMKLMNEVEAEVDGEIVQILVENEEMVGFDQPLFMIK